MKDEKNDTFCVVFFVFHICEILKRLVISFSEGEIVLHANKVCRTLSICRTMIDRDVDTCR